MFIVWLLYVWFVCVLYMYLQYFDTVGWVFWPVKTISNITYSAHSFTTLTATTVCLAVLKSSLASQASGSVDRKLCSSFKAVNKLWLVLSDELRQTPLWSIWHLGSTRLKSLLPSGFDSAAIVLFSCHETKPCWWTIVPPSLHLSTTNGLSLCEV